MAATEEIRLSDYSLVGKDSALAIERGLAEADWYASPVPKKELRRLLERSTSTTRPVSKRDLERWRCQRTRSPGSAPSMKATLPSRRTTP